MAAENTYVVNNIAHSLFKQISIRLNGTLISPQTDTYHYKAYLETLLSYNRDDGETIQKPQGWFNAINMPDSLTANQLDQTHPDFAAMSDEYQHLVRTIQLENAKHAAGKARILCFVPHIEVFHLMKLLVTNVQIGTQLYFNPREVWSMQYHGAVTFRLNAEDIKVRLYLCQVRVSPSAYLELMDTLESGKKLATTPR